MELGAHRAGPEAGAATDGSALLNVLVPQLWPRLGKSGRASLRACNRQALRLSDSCVGSLKLWWSQGDTPAKRATAVAELRGMLARGCRPWKLGLHFSGAHRQDPAAATALGLHVLAELRAASPPPQLTTVELNSLPLTAAVVRAIAMVAPCLRELSLFGYDLSYCTGLPSSLPFRPSLSGVQGLLRLAALHPQQLSLGGVTAPARDPLGVAAPAGLAPPLLQRSRLEALQLCLSHKAQVPSSCFAALLSALAQLPALRSLDIQFLSVQYPGFCGASYPTGLTRLVLDGKLDLDVATPALACMRSLAELQLPCKLRPLHLQLMLGLTALTRLEVLGIWATDKRSSGAPGGLAEPTQPQLLLLPAQLQALVYYEYASTYEVMALQLPSVLLLRLDLAGLALSPDDKDVEGRLRTAAAEALLAACRRLAGRLWHDMDAAEDPFGLDLCGAAAPASWPDGYGTLFAAMQPLALCGLAVRNATLTLYDMDALVRHLPLLEDLRLLCAVELPTLTLLCRLRQLVFLELSPGDGEMVEGWDSELALRTALLVVCVEAPSLEDVYLSVDQDRVAIFEAAVQAVGWLEEELPALRADPPVLQVG